MQRRIDRSIQISQEGGPQCRKFCLQSLKGKQSKHSGLIKENYCFSGLRIEHLTN